MLAIISVLCAISIVPGCRGVGCWGRVQEEGDGGGSNEGAARVTGMKTIIVISHHQRDALEVVWFPTLLQAEEVVGGAWN